MRDKEAQDKKSDDLKDKQRRWREQAGPLGQPLPSGPLGHKPHSAPLGRLPEPDLRK